MSWQPTSPDRCAGRTRGASHCSSVYRDEGGKPVGRVLGILSGAGWQPSHCMHACQSCERSLHMYSSQQSKGVPGALSRPMDSATCKGLPAGPPGPRRDQVLGTLPGSGPSTDGARRSTAAGECAGVRTGDPLATGPGPLRRAATPSPHPRPRGPPLSLMPAAWGTGQRQPSRPECST